MVILGIDPGIASTGYGVIRAGNGGKLHSVDYGTITTSVKDTLEERLKLIYEGITGVIHDFRPNEAAIETVFYSKNLKSLVQVSEAIGVLTLAAYNFGLKIQRFTPLEVKQVLVRSGTAKKKQIQLMVMNILNLKDPPKPDHASDALAVAICYAVSKTIK
ncbi:MAG: crossover junction endodeoxyribonuclease RuvC [Spirochaetota bacterium]|nr:MAG: crossover junction endodeoxyribonuclease RuvC [Spirochaetota bacterium]